MGGFTQQANVEETFWLVVRTKVKNPAHYGFSLTGCNTVLSLPFIHTLMLKVASRLPPVALTHFFFGVSGFLVLLTILVIDVMDMSLR